MKSKTSVISIVVVCAFVVAIVAVSLVTKTSEPAKASDVPGASQSQTSRAATDGTPSSDLTAAEAYIALTKELEGLQGDIQKERSMERRQEILDRMMLILSEFIDDYSGTPEAYTAAFEAGIVYFSAQNPQKAIQYLESFVAKATDAPREKKAYGHYYLAESYKQLDKFDDAEALYKVVLADYGDVDPRLTQAAQQNLAMMESERRLAIGGTPIPFEVTSLKGKPISPDRYRGKVLLLDFWATWCVPCRQEMPNVKKVYKKYNKEGFEIVGISLDRNKGDLDRYIDSNNITWPQYYDGKYWQNEVATKYGISSIPATYLIDKSGKIRYKSLRGPQLERAVQKLLAE
jgi:peroxiredoxin